MKSLHLIGSAGALLIGLSCTEGRALLEPTAPEPSLQANAIAGAPIGTSGQFDALVDFSTLSLTPRGSNCLLTVNGQLVFSGTIEGPAVGTTSALVFATCGEVATSPPGTFRDVFRSELQFEGTVDGEPAEAHMIYQGRVQEGGRIEGRILLSNGLAGVLDVEAQVAVGGSYTGSIVVR